MRNINFERCKMFQNIWFSRFAMQGNAAVLLVLTFMMSADEEQRCRIIRMVGLILVLDNPHPDSRPKGASGSVRLQCSTSTSAA